MIRNISHILDLESLGIDCNNLYVRLIQTYRGIDPYEVDYLDGSKGKKNDQRIFEMALWKTKKRIVKEGQIIIPLLKISYLKDTWLFMNLLKTGNERDYESLKESEKNNPYGYYSHNYDLLGNINNVVDNQISQYFQILKINFHRKRKHQWPLIKYETICQDLIIDEDSIKHLK